MRKYEIAYLTPSGQIEEISRSAPALSAFEDAFGAFGHGAILQTESGPMAVEDLLPGDKVRLSDGTFDTLRWRGMMTLRPDDQETSPEHAALTRITADALGPARPSPDLVLGPTARLLHRAHGVRTLTGKRAAFVPVRDFVDGNQFIALRPVAPVNVYQLGFAAHQRLSVNGIEIESLHPGTAFSLGLRGDLLSQYLSLFPHKRDFDDFGEMRNPRLRLRDLDLLDGG
ncbi:Hint domain-containing protein [Loktanella agnita]|uniref:Hint domain-containing protein n=1 Tax=Loktanella agnita TaxID=287097 RepID=UPI0039880490